MACRPLRGELSTVGGRVPTPGHFRPTSTSYFAHVELPPVDLALSLSWPAIPPLSFQQPGLGFIRYGAAPRGISKLFRNLTHGPVTSGRDRALDVSCFGTCFWTPQRPLWSWTAWEPLADGLVDDCRFLLFSNCSLTERGLEICVHRHTRSKHLISTRRCPDIGWSHLSFGEFTR